MPKHTPQERAKNRRQNVGRAPTTRAAKRQDTAVGRATRRKNVARTPATRPATRIIPLRSPRRTTRRRGR